MARQLTKILGECHQRFVVSSAATNRTDFDDRWLSQDGALSALYRRSVLDALIPTSSFQAAGVPKRLLRNPGETQVGQSAIEFLETFFRDNAELIARSLYWAQIWIDRSDAEIEPMSGRKEVLRQRIARNVAISLAGNPEVFSNTEMDEKAILDRLKWNSSRIGTLVETIDKIENQLESILDQTWKPFCGSEEESRSGEVLVYGFLQDARAVPQQWTRISGQFEVGPYRLDPQDEKILDIFAAQIADNAVYGLVANGKKGPLYVRPRVRRAGSSTLKTRLDWSVEERVSSALRNTRVSAQEFNDLESLLIAEARASSHWLGLTHSDSRLCLATARIMITEASVWLGPILNGTGKEACQTISMPSHRLAKAIFSVVKREREKEQIFVHLEAGEMSSSGVNGESISLELEEALRDNLIPIGMRMTWRRLHFNELRGTPVDGYDNFGAFIGQCVGDGVRKFCRSRSQKLLAARNVRPSWGESSASSRMSYQDPPDTRKLDELIHLAETLNEVIVEGETSAESRQSAESALRLRDLLREIFVLEGSCDMDTDGLAKRWEEEVRLYREAGGRDAELFGRHGQFEKIRECVRECAK